MAEYEIKAEMIKGSGKHGKILKEDIEQHLQTPKETSDEEVINELIETFSEKAEVQPIEEGNAGGVAIAEAVLAEETSDLKEDIDLLIESNNEEKIAEKLNESPPEKKEDEINDMEDANEVDEETTHKEKNEQQQETTDLPIATVTENKTINSVNEALAGGNGSERRVPMTRLRAKIAERLVAAQQTAAILTTFNDVDLSEIIRLRKIYRDRFEQVHGIKLGFMSFFVKAATEALKRYPEVNARIDGQDVVYQGNYDIGVAVSTERGLVVPVVRDTNTLGHAEIEKKIHDYAYRARNNQLELNELTGGTFSITNGGVFGSMLSTPIINPPQSAILGMHKIEDRPVAIKGEVVIRPMMYLALSYDHRLIDGKTAVSFLVKIKELLEDPASLFLEL
ncbi:MAG: dihydrolipoyllysine-residue succinyltransferase [Cocleimonas sp.]|nr:dihydrolipoyllysine-residue succinyltransferase [Cocleimonas sp.]